MNTDDIAKAFQDLENLPTFPPVIIYRYETWKNGWNIAFPNLAFSDEELQAGLSHEQGFLGWRIGTKCFISKHIDFRKETVWDGQ